VTAGTGKLRILKDTKSMTEQLPSNRKFGYFFTFIFAVLAAYFLYTESTVFFYSFSITSVLFFTVTLVHAEFLRPLNRLWMAFGLLLGKIVSPVVMGIIFFGLFSPISLLMRLLGRDELRLKLNKRTSHWRIRNHADGINNHFKNQF